MSLRLFLAIVGLFAIRLAALAWVDGPHRSLATDYCQWDCGWYLDVVRNGYAVTPYALPAQPAIYGQANWAFFPVFPLLVRAAYWVLPVSDIVADLLTANLFLFLFVIMAVLYLPRRRAGTSPAALAAFLLAFPYGLYFSLPYTESLFAFSATATLYMLSYERLTGSAAFAALSSATRLTGILFAPVIAFRAIRPAMLAWQAGDHRQALTKAADGLLPMALAPLGLALYIAYLYFHTGDGLAFAHVQAGWLRHDTSPVATLVANLGADDWKLAFSQYAQSNFVGEYAAIAGLALSCRVAWLRLWPEFWLLAGTDLLALAAGLVSMQRFILANPVFIIFLFDWLWGLRRLRQCYPVLLAGCFALLLYFAHCWLRGYGFLM